MAHDPTKRSLDGRALLWLGEVMRLLLAFAVLAILARTVTAAVLGAYLSVLSVALLMPRLLDFGLPHAFGFFLRLQPDTMRACSSALARHVAMTAPLAVALAFALRFVPFADETVTSLTVDRWLELALLILSELSILLGLATFIPTARFTAYFSTTVLPPCTFLVGLAMMPRSDMGAPQLLDLLLATSLVGASVMAVASVRAGRKGAGAGFPTAAAYRYGLRSYGAAVAKIAAQRFDKLFLVTVLGATGYTQYSFAISLRDMLLVPANLHAMTFRNRQIDLVAREGNLFAALSVLRRTSVIWGVVSLAIGLAILPLWPAVVQICFGAGLEQTEEIVRVVAFSCAPLAIMGYAWNHLYALNHPGRVTSSSWASLLLAVPIFVLCIEFMGPTDGAATAVVVWAAISAALALTWAIVSRPVGPATTSP